MSTTPTGIDTMATISIVVVSAIMLPIIALLGLGVLVLYIIVVSPLTWLHGWVTRHDTEPETYM